MRNSESKANPQEEKELKHMHDSTGYSRVVDCIKAVLLTSEGWRSAIIFQAVRIHETTVIRHMNENILPEKFKSEKG